MPNTKNTKVRELKVRWNVPDELITRFATNFVIQTIEKEFKLSFFEVKPDIVLDEDDRKKLMSKGYVDANCVGSFIITEDRLQLLIDILKNHLDKFGSGKSAKTNIKSKK